MALLRSVPFLVFAFFLAACGADNSDSQTANTEPEKAALTAAPASDMAPCEFLSAADISSVMGIENLAEPTHELVMDQDTWQQSHCTYVDEAGEREISVFVTYGEALSTTEKALKIFDRQIKALTRGVSATAEENGVEATFSYKGEFQFVPGIGARAAWQPAKSNFVLGYLTFVEGNHIFQIHPEVAGKDNDEQALEYARTLAEIMIQ